MTTDVDVLPPDLAVFSTFHLRERGLRPRTGETPAAVEEWKYMSRRGTRHLWRLDQAVPIKPPAREAQSIPVSPETVLLAVWSVNRAAKRRRDAAASSYEQHQHGFAGHHRCKKQEYYDLKDRGLAWLAHYNHIAATHRHGQLVSWSGCGYRFHSTLLPPDIELPETDGSAVFIDAKPRISKELRLIDAVALLESLPSLISNFRRVMPAWQQRVGRAWQGTDDDDHDEDDIPGA
jgi:hypothetical protein